MMAESCTITSNRNALRHKTKTRHPYATLTPNHKAAFSVMN